LTARDPARRPANAGDVAARAGALRDALRTGAIGPAGGSPDLAASSFVGGGAAAPDATTEFSATAAWPLAAPDHYGQGAWPARPATGRPRRSGFLVTMVIALALLAGLGGWVIANLAGAASQPTQPPASHSSAPSVRTVTVNASALTGRPVGEVASLLKQRGLQVTLAWQPAEHAKPGTVISVSPSGPVPVGTTVTITGASSGTTITDTDTTATVAATVRAATDRLSECGFASLAAPARRDPAPAEPQDGAQEE